MYTSISVARIYCEYGKWRYLRPELHNAWEYRWATLSPVVI